MSFWNPFDDKEDREQWLIDKATREMQKKIIAQSKRIAELEEENERISKYAADAEERVAELEKICKEYEYELFGL